MSQITGGAVRYLRRSKTGDYEHHEAEATFNISVEDGEDAQALFNEAFEQAVAKVNSVLGTRPVGVKATPHVGVLDRAQGGVGSPATVKAGTGSIGVSADGTPLTTITASGASASGKPLSEPAPVVSEPAPRGRPRKPPVTVIEDITTEEIEAVKAAKADAAAIVDADEKPNISASPEDRADPAALVDDFVSEPEVTDKVLLDALSKKQAELGNANPIRELLGQYLEKGKGYKDLPQSVRQNFLDKLQALTV